MSAAEVEQLLRKLDRERLSRGWHDHGDTALFYVVRARSGRLFTRQANVPSLDHHTTLVATELLYEIAVAASKDGVLPVRDPGTVGVAWSMEAHGLSIDKDAPVHVRDQFNAARKAREIHRMPGAVEARIISVVFCDGAEGGLHRERDGDVQLMLGPQFGLVYRCLRLLCGLPEDDLPGGRPKVFSE